ncbi:MAG: hypothetical protein LLF90_07140 [Methanomicrobiaceae archaeon]|nr:hypothetical protein [Methanomicrobiaceae archaeon]
MFSGWDTIIGSTLGAALAVLGGFYFTYLEDKRKTTGRHKIVAKALHYEVEQLNNKMGIISKHLTGNGPIRSSGLYSGLKDDSIFVRPSEFSFIMDRNPFEHFYGEIFDLQNDVQVDKLFEYYSYAQEADQHLTALLNVGRQTGHEIFIFEKKDRSIPSSEQIRADIHASECIKCIHKAQSTLDGSHLMQDLVKLIDKKWYRP